MKLGRLPPSRPPACSHPSPALVLSSHLFPELWLLTQFPHLQAHPPPGSSCTDQPLSVPAAVLTVPGPFPKETGMFHRGLESEGPTSQPEGRGSTLFLPHLLLRCCTHLTFWPRNCADFPDRVLNFPSSLPCSCCFSSQSFFSTSLFLYFLAPGLHNFYLLKSC